MRRSATIGTAIAPEPPGPRSLIPGKFLRSMQRSATTFLAGLHREYGDVVRFTIGPRDLYSFAHPDAVRDIVITHDRSFIKSLALQRSKIVLGEGLLTSEGEFHLRQRRLAQPAFHRDRIRRYGEVMSAFAVRARERWSDGERVDIHREMMKLTLAVVAKTLFDADVESEADEIGGALTEIMLMFPKLLNPFIELLLKLPIPQVRRFERALARLDRTIYDMIAARRASGEDRGDLLSMLLLAQDTDNSRMTDRQLRDESMTLFLAGHETTANALAWTMYLVALHRDVQSRLQSEIDAVLGDRPPSPDDFPRLRYAEMVLAESMRLYPPAWGFGRMATENVEIAGYELPRGAIALVSQWVTHRDARFWPDPERFDPMRFAEEPKASRPRFAYFPFGGGSRVCIGEGFAWMEGVLILAAVAQKWRLVRDDPRPVVPQPLITLRPRGGIHLRLESRHARREGALR